MAILSMIPQGDPDLTAYQNELLSTKQTRAVKKTDSGSQYLKTLESLRITPQYRKNPQRRN